MGNICQRIYIDLKYPYKDTRTDAEKYEDFIMRITAPIPSFEGNPPTEGEKKEIQKMLDYFGVKRDNTEDTENSKVNEDTENTEDSKVNEDSNKVKENDTIEKTEEKGIKFFDVQPVG